MSTGTALIGVFNQIKEKIYVSQKKIFIENFVFRLFSKFTVAALFLCAGLVTLQQLIGEHIKCILPPKDDIRPEALNQYCFIMSTYTLPHLYNKSLSELFHFGVGPHNPEVDEQKYHSYYQWVPFVLFFQAMCFSVPHILWKAWEDNRIRAYSHLELVHDVKMQDRKLISPTDNEAVQNQVKIAAKCFQSYMYYNYFYAGVYVLCEILNFVIVIVNIFLTDAFLGNEFTTYGSEVVQFMYADPETRIDPMSRVFPKVTKCDFHKYGPSGTIVRYDIMCVLALNILNEKIYVFLWFWFVMLAILGGLNLIYRVITIIVPAVRTRLLLRKVPEQYEYNASFVVNRLNFADWFLLKRIADNIHSGRFGEFCHALNGVLADSPVFTNNRKDGRSPVPLMSPPPTYDSSTLPLTDTMPSDSLSKGAYPRSSQYPTLTMDGSDGGQEESEPLVTSKF